MEAGAGAGRSVKSLNENSPYTSNHSVSTQAYLVTMPGGAKRLKSHEGSTGLYLKGVYIILIKK
jgi:hypothetical protein